ncbi:hypothetical protein [Acrocarpospora catenulata]|uniref:hypothetical protein n=1 Tax=Acrocarpospora catenulata TaxID=2836182 RepID=UPI001BDAD958|nr:hypothetical protein [Acrocarpospora catenulata]
MSGERIFRAGARAGTAQPRPVTLGATTFVTLWVAVVAPAAVLAWLVLGAGVLG